MKTKTMISSVFALVVALSLSAFALVGCANTPQDNPEDNPTIEATDTSEDAVSTEEQSQEAPEASTVADSTDAAPASDSGSDASYSPSQGASGGNSGAKTSGDSGNTQSAPKAQAAPSKPAHQHSWVDITETRTVTDKAAWTEKIPIRGMICSCGATFSDRDAARSHTEATRHSYSSGTVDYSYVNHPAQTHTETVVVGQRCSTCGATK